MAHDQQQQLATWNPTRDCWETTQQGSLFSELSDVFSETWPRSGSIRSGVAFELPTWAPATAESECLSSPGIPNVSPLLPTVMTQNNDNRQSEGFGPNLGTVLRALG